MNDAAEPNAHAAARIQGGAAILGALAVTFGAIGAHLLEKQLGPEALEWHHTAATYHFWHAVALWLAGDLVRRTGRGTAAALLFVAGILLFSGSLYAMALTGARALGAVTPFGGVAFIAGWMLLARAAVGTRP